MKIKPAPVTALPLHAAFQANAPRASWRTTPWQSVAVHGGVLLTWALAVLAAFGLGGVWAWSSGLAYVVYDTVLLTFTAIATWQLVRGAHASIDAGRPLASSVNLTGTTSTESGTSTQQTLRVGVIIAARNEATVLAATIAGLQAQSRVPDVVLLADDGSDDGTAHLLTQTFRLQPLAAGAPADAPLCWLRLPHGGKARALNAALPLLTVDVLLTIDADTLLEPHAIQAMLAAFQSNPHLVAATGVIRPVCGQTLQGRVLEWFQTYEYIRNFLSRYAWMRADGLLLISGAFAGFRRTALLQVGGFDPDCLVEDYELIHRLRRFSVLHGLHWTTAVVGGAYACTEAPGTLAAFVRQRKRWFGGFLQTQYWYRDMVGNARYGALGTRMLVVKAIDTLQPLFGLTALAIALTHLVRGDWRVVVPVAGVISAKILVDLGFHLWSVHVYRCWLGPQAARLPRFSHALLAALAEPFSFQILRHVSATAGWWVFLAGRRQWGAQHRVAGALRRVTTSPAASISAANPSHKGESSAESATTVTALKQPGNNGGSGPIQHRR